ncbi:MAG: phosphoribosylamine--glycine ligase [Rickettsiales bacterium]
MNKVLVIGGGGREHALCWRLKQSPSVAQVFCAGGNAGIAQDVTCVNLASPEDVANFCKTENIALVVIGPEQPLVDGLSDYLRTKNIPVFAPSQKAAQLEASKGFMKDICQKYNIPTATYGFFADKNAALTFLEGKTLPIVVKVDGLAAGKGVIIAETKKEAIEAVENMFSGEFGATGTKVVIEEFLEGFEASFFALCDGKKAVEFGYAQDHKRAYDGDKGPNTGGMGTYSPPPIMTAAIRKEVMEKIINPTMVAMEKEGAPFTGVLFAGLMLTKDGVKLLEYNVRFGDPETQSLMMRFDGDLFQLLLSCANGEVDKKYISFTQQAAVCVVMAANGYPAAYEKDSVISGLKKAGSFPNVKIFHAGTAEKNGEIISVGGRVLGVTALGNTIKEAQENAYRSVDIIDWKEGFCRRDIAWQAV